MASPHNQKQGLYILIKSKNAVLTLYANNLTTTFNLPRYPYNELLKFNSFFDFVKHLFRHVDVNIVTEGGESVLQWLCRVYQERDLVQLVQFVCDLGANVNYCHPADQTSPLISLVLRSFYHFEGTLDVAAELIKRGANVNHKNIDGRNVFNLLCFEQKYWIDNRARQYLSFMKFLVRSSNIDISNVDVDGQDNLFALLTGKLGGFRKTNYFVIWPAVKLLLCCGFVFNPPLERLLWTVVCVGETDLVRVHSFIRLLIERKVDVNRPDIWRITTPAHFRQSVLSVLLQMNGNACKTEKEEECWRNIIVLFLDAGLDINKFDERWDGTPGETTLMVFCYFYRGRNFIELLEILLNRGANPDAMVERSAFIGNRYYNLSPNSDEEKVNGMVGFCALDFFLLNKFQQKDLHNVKELLLHRRKR